MSTTVANIAPLLSTAIPEKRRRRQRPYKARVATKIKWALGDVMDKTISAQTKMREMLAWIEEEWGDIGSDDHARLKRLARLDHIMAGLALDVCEIERVTARAVTESKTAD